MRYGFVAVFVLVSCFAHVAAADPPPPVRTADDASARLRDEYLRTQHASPGCEHAELERRAGRVDVASRVLSEIVGRFPAGVEGGWEGTDEARATMAACHFNLGRVREDQRAYARAMESYGHALDTPVARRRAVVEGAVLRVADAIVAEGGCDRLGGALRVRGVLRYGDSRALRACLRELEREQPTCRVLRGAELREWVQDAYLPPARDGVRVGATEGGLLVVRGEGANPSSGFVCPSLASGGGSATYLTAVRVGREQFLIVQTFESVTSACDCAEGEGEGEEDDCRCESRTLALHVLTADGRHRLSVVDELESNDQDLTVPNWYAAAYVGEWGGSSTRPAVEGDVLTFAGRRLTLRSGVLVPAPPVAAPVAGRSR